MKVLFFRRKERGIGMIEVAISVAIAGIFVLAFWTLTQASRQQAESVQDTALLTRADLVVRNFLFQNNRLPCPASDNSGYAQQGCAPGASGWLPFRDLGLPEARAGFVKYTVQGYPKAGSPIVGIQSDNTAQLQLLIGESPLAPRPVLVSPQDPRVNVSSPYMGLCSVITAPVAPGIPVPPAYTLQLQSRASNVPAGEDGSLLSITHPANAADSTQTLSRSFAELATGMSCPPQLASSARTMFHNWLSTQILLAGLNGYQKLLAISVQAAIDDIVNDAIPASTSGLIRVEAKMVSLNTATGKCAEDPDSCGATLGIAYTDAVTAAVNEALAVSKVMRDALNEMAAASFNNQLAMQIMALTALQSTLMQQHALWAIEDGVSP